MLNILIVEDDALFATMLGEMLTSNPRYQVTGIAAGLDEALEAAAARPPDLALVDLNLGAGGNGFAVAAALVEQEVACLFVTGRAPPAPIPDLALGCLVKPFTEDDLIRALRAAEDRLRGREPVRPHPPQNLRMYDGSEPQPAAVADADGVTTKAEASAQLTDWLGRLLRRARSET